MQDDTNFMNNTNQIKELFIKAYFTTKRLKSVCYITNGGFQDGDKNIRERDDTLTATLGD